MTPKYITNFVSFLEVIRIEKPVKLVQLDTLATVRHIQHLQIQIILVHAHVPDGHSLVQFDFDTRGFGPNRLFHPMKKKGTIQYGYWKWGTHA